MSPEQKAQAASLQAEIKKEAVAEAAAAPIVSNAPTPVFYTVEDLNATASRKKKHHTVQIPQANGKYQLKGFEFRPETATKMPMEIALLFLDIDPAFRVRNSKGQIVRPKKFAATDMRNVTLRPYEIAVSVTQVLKKHLYELARMMPGGTVRFTDESTTKREDLEEFIISGGTVEEDEDGQPIDMIAA